VSNKPCQRCGHFAGEHRGQIGHPFKCLICQCAEYVPQLGAGAVADAATPSVHPGEVLREDFINPLRALMEERRDVGAAARAPARNHA
jgi:hypothetical protein